MAAKPPRARPDAREAGRAEAHREERRRRGPARRRASHSLESVLSEAVALLDESGEQALTFRALADRLGGGVASIYWYVDSKDELLDRAADHVLEDVLEDVVGIGGGTSRGPIEDALSDVRTIAVTLFDAIVERPWLGAYFMRDTDVQPHALRLYELMGQQVLRLPLTTRQAFHAVSAVVGFVVGTAADMGQEAPEAVLSGEVDARSTWLGTRSGGGRSMRASSRSCTASSTSSPDTTTPTSSGPGSTCSSPDSDFRPRGEIGGDPMRVDSPLASAIHRCAPEVGRAPPHVSAGQGPFGWWRR